MDYVHHRVLGYRKPAMVEPSDREPPPLGQIASLALERSQCLPCSL
jgi:hypothetical protein